MGLTELIQGRQKSGNYLVFNPQYVAADKPDDYNCHALIKKGSNLKGSKEKGFID
ncbi:hypothetical protein [Alicyclobacillus dauci]|uniref:Uncharacterized protein n=1 Tax=Alicyclobacillus dauci TaxID=1475485 RepID=A0ABY6Z437_9BACL|nr:hypothetical protein [Alicyclobacillus dauci]WAH37524.1 hypothetical protein NZD86_03025 [Alicyclobacillus dauci]